MTADAISWSIGPVAILHPPLSVTGRFRAARRDFGACHRQEQCGPRRCVSDAWDDAGNATESGTLQVKFFTAKGRFWLRAVNRESARRKRRAVLLFQNVQWLSGFYCSPYPLSSWPAVTVLWHCSHPLSSAQPLSNSAVPRVSDTEYSFSPPTGVCMAGTVSFGDLSLPQHSRL